MTKRTFKECMLLLGVAFNTELHEDNKTKLYWEYLKDLEDQAVKKAIDKVIRENEWFPKIAEIRNIAKNYQVKVFQLPVPTQKEISFKEVSKDIKALINKILHRPTTVKKQEIKYRKTQPMTQDQWSKRRELIRQQAKDLAAKEAI